MKNEHVIKRPHFSNKLERIVIWTLIVFAHVALLKSIHQQTHIKKREPESSVMMLVSALSPSYNSNITALKHREKNNENVAVQERRKRNNKINELTKTITTQDKSETAPVLDREQADTLIEPSQSLAHDKPSIASSQTVTKELNNLHNLSKRYQLEIPKGELVRELNPAQQAAQDVRSNSVNLTKSETYETAMNKDACVFQSRQSNGQVIRTMGYWVEINARGARKQKARFCIRNPSDLAEIMSGMNRN